MEGEGGKGRNKENISPPRTGRMSNGGIFPLKPTCTILCAHPTLLFNLGLVGCPMVHLGRWDCPIESHLYNLSHLVLCVCPIQLPGGNVAKSQHLHMWDCPTYEWCGCSMESHLYHPSHPILYVHVYRTYLRLVRLHHGTPVPPRIVEFHGQSH